MKSLALLICALLFLTASAYHRFNFLDEDDMLEYMKDEDHHIYVLFFYNGDESQSNVGEMLRKRNDEERVRVQEQILDKFP